MVNLPKIFKDENKDDQFDSSKLILPLLPLRDIVVFPFMVAPLFVGRPKSVSALTDAMNKDKSVFLATQKKASVDNPSEKDISLTGTIGKVLQLLRLPDGTVKALVEGKSRGHIARFIQKENFFQVEIEPVVEPEVNTAEGFALSRTVLENFEKYAEPEQKHIRGPGKQCVCHFRPFETGRYHSCPFFV